MIKVYASKLGTRYFLKVVVSRLRKGPITTSILCQATSQSASPADLIRRKFIEGESFSEGAEKQSGDR